MLVPLMSASAAPPVWMLTNDSFNVCRVGLFGRNSVLPPTVWLRRWVTRTASIWVLVLLNFDVHLNEASDVKVVRFSWQAESVPVMHWKTCEFSGVPMNEIWP